jgi:hypothetical protein
LIIIMTTKDLVELNKLLKSVSVDMANLNARTRSAYVRHLKGLMVPLMEDSGRWTRKAIQEFEAHDHATQFRNVLKDLGTRIPK